MVSTVLHCFVFILFSLTVRVKSQFCHRISQYNRCSPNSACACFHIAGAIDTGICVDEFVDCSELVTCEHSNNVCSEPNYRCVHHPRCHNLPVCYPIPSFNQQLCSSTATMNTTTTTTIPVTTTINTQQLTTRPIMIAPNLLLNPGAEERSIAGWRQTGPATAIVDSNGAFNSNYYPHSGSYCFAGGKGVDGSSSGLVQNVKLLGGIQDFTESQLDTRSFMAELHFYYQTWDSFFMRHDQVEVSLTFRSASSSILNIVTTGELACKTSNPGWCRYMKGFPTPRGTR
ncbi:unnamed protein product, partial [Rotaria sordida]